MSEAPNTVYTTPDDALLLPHEAAALLRRTPKTLASWRSLGRGPRWRKLEGRAFYAMVDLRRYMAGEVCHGEA
jgi:hypothetical protein